MIQMRPNLIYAIISANDLFFQWLHKIVLSFFIGGFQKYDLIC